MRNYTNVSFDYTQIVLCQYFYKNSIDIGKGKLTVGKIYGGLLILENWKASKFGNMPSQKVSKSQFLKCSLQLQTG